MITRSLTAAALLGAVLTAPALPARADSYFYGGYNSGPVYHQPYYSHRDYREARRDYREARREWRRDRREHRRAHRRGHDRYYGHTYVAPTYVYPAPYVAPPPVVTYPVAPSIGFNFVLD